MSYYYPLNKMMDNMLKHASEEQDERYRLMSQGFRNALASAAIHAGLEGIGYGAPPITNESANLAKELLETSPVPVKTTIVHGAAYVEPTEAYPKGYLRISKDFQEHPGAIAKQLGHYDVSTSGLGKVLQNHVTKGLYQASPLIGMVSGAATAHLDDERQRLVGRLFPVALVAPEFAAQVYAAAKGLGRLRRAGASGRELMSAAASMFPDIATRGAAMAGSYGLAQFTQNAFDRRHE